MIFRRVAVLLLLGSALYAQSPKLLLTSQRLRRLQRERERQTERWINFEQRVQNVPDSPERGFELALYYAVTGNPERGTAAIRWAVAHPCEKRQVALVWNWAGQLASDNERRSFVKQDCPDASGPWQRLRDHFFLQVQSGGESSSPEPLAISELPPVWDLYALVEYLDAFRSTQFADLRQEQPSFFARLPAEFLLSLTPKELEHPSWQDHVTALALIALDPNLPESRFLQGWALEDRNMVHDGPGVGYELLWANPYLPGVSYQNREPWVYADNPGTLWARSDWTAHACWVHIAAGHMEQRNCPPGWERAPAKFGSLTLLSLAPNCAELPGAAFNRAVLIHADHPNMTLTFTVAGERRTAKANAAGLWFAPDYVSGKVCIAHPRAAP